jgi:hypothetical protein
MQSFPILAHVDATKTVNCSTFQIHSVEDAYRMCIINLWKVEYMRTPVHQECQKQHLSPVAACCPSLPCFWQAVRQNMLFKT